MSVSSTGQSPVSFEIKSAQLPLVALFLKTEDWVALRADLLQKFGPTGESPDFFDHDALVIDFSHLPADLPSQDIVPLLQALRRCRLVAVALRGANAAWMAEGRKVGLVEAVADAPRVRPQAVATEAVVHEVIREVTHEVAGPLTMVIDKPLRSGQKVYARGGDLVVLAMVNQGAEVVADGNIHVYAPLRGKAMAGASGNVNARIFSLCLEPELISIAGIYRTSENPLAAEVQGKPAQVRLSNDGQDKLLFEALNP
jgi:septum site-determining protein MinC